MIGPAAATAPLEALIVDRDAIIRMMRLALEEMNARRGITPHCTGEVDIIQALRYWDEVFGWIKQQSGHDLVLMTRREPSP